MKRKDSLIACLALFISASTELAAAGGWVDCLMTWSEVEANREISNSVIMPLRFHAAVEVMRFEKIKLEAKVQTTTSETLEDGTRVRLSLWQEEAGYRMAYVWEDMDNGIEYELYGQEWFAPTVVWQAHFFGGRLNCD